MEHSRSLKSCERDTEYSRFQDAASGGGGGFKLNVSPA